MKISREETTTIIRALESYRDAAKHSANAAREADSLFYWKEQQVKAHYLLIRIRVDLEHKRK